MTETSTTTKPAAIDAFRTAADLLEQHPNIPVPVVIRTGLIYWHLYDWESYEGGVAATVARIRRAIGGTWTKHEADDGKRLSFNRDGYEISVERESVCTRRVVGTETVTLPAVEAQPERTEEREVVEWDCQPILAEVPC